MNKRPLRRLTVIVSSDVVGYSRLIGRDEAGTLAILRGWRVELADPLLAEYGGQIVKTMGDGLLIDFPSAVDATQWALDIQQETANRYAGRDPEKMFTLRVGIHLGDIVIEDDDIFGEGVNIATRLQEIAEPGGICISGAVQEQIEGKICQSFDDLGFRRLKNIDRPIRVHRARMSGGSAHEASPRAWPYITGTPGNIEPETSGGCLCGRVRFDIWGEAAAVGYCHCRMCQLALGAPLNAWAAFRQTDVTFPGDAPKVFRSSPIARRAFCSECGTSIYTEIEGADATQYYSIRLATLDNPEDFPPTCHFGVESRLPWLNVEDDLPRIRTEDDAVLSAQWTAAGESRGGPARKTAMERLQSRPKKED